MPNPVWKHYSVRIKKGALSSLRYEMRVGGDMVQVKEQTWLNTYISGGDLIRAIKAFEDKINNNDTEVFIEDNYDSTSLQIAGWRAATDKEKALLAEHMAELAENDAAMKQTQIEQAKKLLKDEGLL